MSEIKSHAANDVRMQGFARRHTVAAALAWLDAQLGTLGAEDVPLRSAAGRVLAESITSDIDIPGFDRATMDGYAVVADSTEGATSYNRVLLTVIGDALPGSPFQGRIGRGEAVRIMTGAPMPARRAVRYSFRFATTRPRPTCSPTRCSIRSARSRSSSTARCA